MVKQLKIIQSDKAKGKSASRGHEAAEALDYLITFNKSIIQTMARITQELYQYDQPDTCMRGQLYGLS